MELETLTQIGDSHLDVKISLQDESVESFAEDVLIGLSSYPKTLPPKYFYDEIGSKLFEKICELPEYYLTRTERAILHEYAGEIATVFDRDIALIEFGSGNSSKTSLLIEAFIHRFERLHYVPIDISRSILVEASNKLLDRYNHLRITAYVSDYHTALRALREENLGGKLILFLGSSIGNFEPEEMEAFLKKTLASMSSQDRMLVGTDLMKGGEVLVPAYDDPQGVTARFNINMLVRLNRELGANFDLSKWKHRILLNRQQGRIEMHLESLAHQVVFFTELNRSFQFQARETIHSENSYKFTPERFQAIANASGFEIQQRWTDSRDWFALNLLRPIVL